MVHLASIFKRDLGAKFLKGSTKTQAQALEVDYGRPTTLEVDDCSRNPDGDQKEETSPHGFNAIQRLHFATGGD